LAPARAARSARIVRDDCKRAGSRVCCLIRCRLADHNVSPKPFVCTIEPNTIIAAANRG
jgi:hypothetical protein